MAHVETLITRQPSYKIHVHVEVLGCTHTYQMQGHRVRFDLLYGSVVEEVGREGRKVIMQAASVDRLTVSCRYKQCDVIILAPLF